MDTPEHLNGVSPEPVTAGLRSFDSYYTREDGRPINAELRYDSFVCEECGELKADVVGYTVPAMFLVPQLIRFDHLVKCRRCMRWHIVTRLWLVALLAHFVAPFFVAWWLVVFVQTFFRRPG